MSRKLRARLEQVALVLVLVLEVIVGFNLIDQGGIFGAELFALWLVAAICGARISFLECALRYPRQRGP